VDRYKRHGNDNYEALIPQQHEYPANERARRKLLWELDMRKARNRTNITQRSKSNVCPVRAVSPMTEKLYRRQSPIRTWPLCTVLHTRCPQCLHLHSYLPLDRGPGPSLVSPVATKAIHFLHVGQREPKSHRMARMHATGAITPPTTK
jgi:hypothetical protein